MINRDQLFAVVCHLNGFVDRNALMQFVESQGTEEKSSIQEALVDVDLISERELQVISSVVDQMLVNANGDADTAFNSLDIKDDLRTAMAESVKLEGATVVRENGRGDLSHSDPGEAFGQSSSSGNRFEKLRPYAQGGLGEVFVATDRELNREVAVKELKSASDKKSDNRFRFVEEAKITGNLEHPGIVPVYGLGTKSDGSPFYAMRFVRGNTLQEEIDQFHSDERQTLDASSLEFRKMLGQFVDICNAVEYAHQQGVIHRDLKPSNVIVGNYGETLVVDWGLAKVIQANGEVGNEDQAEVKSIQNRTLRENETADGTILGTPAFMSPEQVFADKEKLGVQSDVFSLGATLYCILTGKKPLIAHSEMSTFVAVANRRFERPRKLKPELSPALEAICLKAMAKEPANRYASVSEMATEIEKWMADEPVSAHRDSWIIRAARWSRKHKTLVAATGVLLLTAFMATLIASVLINNEKNRVEAQRQVARQNFDLARKAVDDFFVQVSESTLLKSELPGLRPLRRQLLAQALAYYEKFMREYGDDPDVVDAAANAQFKVAAIQSEIGNADQARDAIKNALKANDMLVALRPDDTGVLSVRARLMQMTAENLFRDGEEKIAMDFMTDVVDLREIILATDEQDQTKRQRMADGLIWLSNCERRLGLQEKALEHAKEAVSIAEKVVQDFPDNDSALMWYSRALQCLGSIYYHRGDPKMLEISQLNVLQQRQLAALKPNNISYKVELASTLYAFANNLFNQQQAEQAAEKYFESILVMEPIANQNPSVKKYQLRLASSEMMYAHAMLSLKDFDAGEKYATLAADRLQLQIDQGRTELRIVRDLAGARNALATVKSVNKDFEGALEQNRLVIDALEGLNSKDPVILYNTAATYAECASLIEKIEKPSDELKQQQQLYLSECVKSCRKAYSAGWNNLNRYEQGFGKSLLLDYPAFQKFLSEMKDKK